MRVLMTRLALCAAVLAASPVVALAQAAMPKVIKIVVPFSPGASNDAVARAIAVPLAQRLQATVIVENKAGAAGVGSIGHLATVLLSDAAKVKLTHVPYKGAANAAQDMGGGQIDVMISNYSTLAPLIQKEGGRVRALAVTSKQPHPSFAGLPALATSVPGYDMDIWIGVFAPAGTPPAIVDRLNREISAISASPELAVVLGPDGTLPQAMGASAFATRVKDELAKWKQLAAAHKIVAE